MALRNFTNTATEATLSGGIAAGATSITLSGFAGFPAAPFTAVIDRGTADEEIVLVTAVGGSTVTATRGYDSTTAKTHAVGAPFIHAVVAKDFDEANDHVNAAAGVHGLTGSVVGDSDVQTLSNKTLTSPTLTSPTLSGTATATNLTVSGSATVPTPSAGTHAATKSYVDGLIVPSTELATPSTNVKRDASGNTAIDAVTLTDAPTAAGHATRKDYVDTGLAAKAPLASPTFTGTVTVPTPAVSGAAATKGYVDGLVADSGWVNCTVGAGRTAHTNAPQVRKIGSVVHFRGGWTDAGMAINTAYTVSLSLPAGYRPPQTTVITPGHGAANRMGRMTFFSGGDIQIDSGPTLAGYYVGDGTSWTVD